jgi:hypothetical protein
VEHYARCGKQVRQETRGEKDMVEFRTKMEEQKTRSSLTKPRHMTALEMGQRVQIGVIPAVQDLLEHRTTRNDQNRRGMTKDEGK